MNLRDLILECRSLLDEPVAAEWTDAELTRWLNQAVRIMCEQSLPLQAVYTTATTVGQQEYVLPANVLKIFSAAYMDGRLYQLRPADFNGAQSGVYIQGIVTHYYLRNLALETAPQTAINSVVVADTLPDKPGKARTVIGLLPVPSGTNASLYVYYFSDDMVLKNDGDETNIPHAFLDALISFAVAKAKMKDQAYEEAQLFAARFKDGLEGLARHFMLDGTDAGFPHVTNPDEYNYAQDLLMDARFILPS